MSYFMINPGTGPVWGRVTLDNAYVNLQRLLDDAGRGSAEWRRDVDATEDDGRFAFLVPIDGEDVSVLMPGCPFHILTAGTVSAPRIYIDGNSWWYEIAIGVLATPKRSVSK